MYVIMNTLHTTLLGRRVEYNNEKGTIVNVYFGVGINIGIVYDIEMDHNCRLFQNCKFDAHNSMPIIR